MGQLGQLQQCFCFELFQIYLLITNTRKQTGRPTNLSQNEQEINFLPPKNILPSTLFEPRSSSVKPRRSSVGRATIR